MCLCTAFPKSMENSVLWIWENGLETEGFCVFHVHKRIRTFIHALRDNSGYATQALIPDLSIGKHRYVRSFVC